jgi:hypothetical protein
VKIKGNALYSLFTLKQEHEQHCNVLKIISAWKSGLAIKCSLTLINAFLYKCCEYFLFKYFIEGKLPTFGAKMVREDEYQLI